MSCVWLAQVSPRTCGTYGNWKLGIGIRNPRGKCCCGRHFLRRQYPLKRGGVLRRCPKEVTGRTTGATTPPDKRTGQVGPLSNKVNC